MKYCTYNSLDNGTLSNIIQQPENECEIRAGFATFGKKKFLKKRARRISHRTRNMGVYSCSVQWIESYTHKAYISTRLNECLLSKILFITGMFATSWFCFITEDA